MSTRLINALAILAIVGILALFASHFIPMVWTGPKQKFVESNDVNGIDVSQRTLLWTLNFKQQNEVLNRINQSMMIKKSDFEPTQDKFPFDSITIHRFKDKDIILKPIGKKNKNIVFSVPQLNNDSYLQDVSEGALQSFLETTYDPLN